jgi:hypothetical protein
MKRPFKDKRLFGPLFADYSVSVPNRVPPEADEYIATVHLSGDVSEYSQEKAQFASFVKAAFREHGLFYSTYRGWTNESPYKGDKYLCKAKAEELLSPGEMDSMIDMINDRVVGLAAPEFRVENIEFKLEE